MRPIRKWKKSIPTETCRFNQKGRRYSQKYALRCSPELSNKSKTKRLKKYKNTGERDISFLCRSGPAWPIFTIFGVSGHTADIIIHTKFPFDRSESYGVRGQNWVFLNDFHHRRYTERLRCVFRAANASKYVCFLVSAPDPAGGCCYYIVTTRPKRWYT